MKHHGWRTRRRTASRFFPNAGVLEKDAAFKTSDIFESKVHQWRSERFPQPSQGDSVFWWETISDIALPSRQDAPSRVALLSHRYSASQRILCGISGVWKCPGRVGRTIQARRSYAATRCTLISGTREPPSSVSYTFTDSRSYLLHGVKACKRPLRSVFHFTRARTGIKVGCINGRLLVDHVTN